MMVKSKLTSTLLERMVRLENLESQAVDSRKANALA